MYESERLQKREQISKYYPEVIPVLNKLNTIVQIPDPKINILDDAYWLSWRFGYCTLSVVMRYSVIKWHIYEPITANLLPVWNETLDDIKPYLELIAINDVMEM